MKYLKFPRKKSLKIVDLGCAEEWYYVRDTIEEGIDVYGNASTCALENALDKVKDRNPFGSLTEIPFSDGEEFDIVTVFDPLNIFILKVPHIW